MAVSHHNRVKEDKELVLQLSDSKPKVFMKFDPTIKPEDRWVHPALSSILDKHFNDCLLTPEREAILKDFPNCSY